MKKSMLAKHKIEMENASLIEAVVDGNVTEVTRLLIEGVNPCAANSEGFTALHFSAFSGNAEIAALLVDRGASVIALDKDGQSPITVAQKRGHRNVADLLLRCFFAESKERQ